MSESYVEEWLVDEIQKLCKENAHLRTALEKFANEDNWLSIDTIDGFPMEAWNEDSDGPWKIAQEALKGREGDDD